MVSYNGVNVREDYKFNDYITKLKSIVMDGRTMDINQSNGENYWFVLREDESNVIVTSNNFTIQNPQGVEARYVVDTVDNEQYIQFNDTNISAPPHTHHSAVSTQQQVVKESKESNFWDRNKIKTLLTLCLQNKSTNLNDKRLAELWSDIASLLDTTPEECSKKYKNLRRTYVRLQKKKDAGIDIKWVHYRTCEEVFKEYKLSHAVLEPWGDAKVRLMLHLYLENLNRFNDPECLKKDVWKDIARQLNTTEYNCYHKFKNLKRTYLNLLEKSRDSRKIMKWPYQHYFERIYCDYRPTPSPWDMIAIKRLLDAYAQRVDKFKNPRYMKKELWREISREVGQNPSKCDKKFRNLKQTYIKQKLRAQSGGAGTKWRYYKEFEKIFNNNTCHVEEGGTRSPNYITQMLSFYIENKDKFRDPLTKKKCLWKIIGRKLGLTPEECNKKFRNMKKTYLRLLEKKRETGECNRWPYFSFFEKIFDESEFIEDASCEDVRLSEIHRAVTEVHERREKDEKFFKLMKAVEESNNIQKERNRILKALLDRS